jgi:hypothetical protein
MHPSIDRGDITIIFDQDKGIKSAIKHVLQSVGHFFCSWHRCKNIILQCGGAGGRVPYTALWLFNKLSKCQSVAQWERERNQYFPKMHSEGHTIFEQCQQCFAVCCEVVQRGGQHLHVPPHHVAGVRGDECSEPRDTLQDSHVSC